jgi:hypothetical protein
MIEITGQKVVVEGANGFHWSSGWERTYWTLYPWSSRADGGFRMPRSSFDEIKDKEVRVRIEYALAVRRSTGSQEVTAAAGPFEVAPAIKCDLSPAFRGSLQCRAPLSHPPLLITADLSASTCVLSPRERAEKAFSWAPAQSTYGGISPVLSFRAILVNEQTSESIGSDARPAICPGTKLEVRAMEAIQRVRNEVEINGIKLGSYRWDPVYGGGTIGWDPVSIMGR